MYVEKIFNEGKLVNEIITLQLIRVLLFAHLICLTYDILQVYYLPIKLWSIPPYWYILLDMLIGTLVYIIWVLMLIKLLKVCKDRIIENCDFIEHNKITLKGLNE